MNEDLFQLGIKALIFNHEGKLLLLKVNEANLRNYGDKEAYWDIPGGRVHRGSSIDVTLRREIKEETGITDISDIMPFTMVLSNIRIPSDSADTGLILSIYTRRARVDSVVLSDEHTEYDWFYPAEASALLRVKYPPEFTDKILKMSKRLESS